MKCCVDSSYDPDFRYASNEPTPPDWAVGLGLEDGVAASTPQTKTPIIKSSPFDSGYARSNPSDTNSNGQCECKSFEKSIG